MFNLVPRSLFDEAKTRDLGTRLGNNEGGAGGCSRETGAGIHYDYQTFKTSGNQLIAISLICT